MLDDGAIRHDLLRLSRRKPGLRQVLLKLRSGNGRCLQSLRTSQPSASRFCSECGHSPAGAALASRFASPQTYTPRDLAEKIRSLPPAPEGERKHVSVLFVDVAGFTSIAEKLDPEDVQAIMRRCFDLMLDEVHRYEGTVSQFLGTAS